MYIGDLTLISPALYMCAAAILVLIVGVFAAKQKSGKLEHYLPAHYFAPALMVPAAILGGWVIIQSLLISGDTASVNINGQSQIISLVGLFITSGGHAQLTVDPFAAIFSFVAIIGTLIVMFISIDYFGEGQPHKAEYYSLLMFSTVAASLAAASSDLIAAYLTIELLSMTSYILAAYAKSDRRSAEAGLKYFLYGAASSAVMLYGMSILFGITGGSTSFSAIANGFAGANETAAGWVGVMFTLVGLGFKIALVPFHFWAPDTYEGAPTPITAFLSVVSKAAGLAVLMRFMVIIAGPNANWYWVLVVLTAITMFYGNLVAIAQTNIKRMLAYSSIAQVGYMMIGVLASLFVFGPRVRSYIPSSSIKVDVWVDSQLPWELQGVIIYIMAYLFMNLGAFAVISAVSRRIGSVKIDDYAGLMKRSPFYAAALTVFLVSLAGVPPTAGFLGKFFIFGSAIRIGMNAHPELVVLAVFGIINSVISVFYYLNVVRVMFFMQSDKKIDIQGSFAVNSAILTTLILTLAMILLAKPLSDLTWQALYGLFQVH